MEVRSRFVIDSTDRIAIVRQGDREEACEPLTDSDSVATHKCTPTLVPINKQTIIQWKRYDSRGQ